MQLHSENQDLREKLTVYESVISSPSKPRSRDEAGSVMTNDSNFMISTNGDGKHMINDIMGLKKEKKLLEHRIRNLELENTELQQKVHPKTYHLKEPKRSLYEMSQNLYDYNQALLLK
eukprot:CAMPEP_0114593242 /NCGR_PEP_ID=MMETSP0125-20121206/14867_1 /TAXON_ID=485358 ORGANISM="Aristerostoma sp., Strain ATCC 50986" /NCGR_SAMPLE_ID=MMETSP0125 /ASSEMBLY_ACC=CAM_ASM_000245 /LENGTH=117 /DNA_ID=CAMNT_0001792287 /DNA_START=973 /DNA_END=1326 /DNA_ORIENTATION=+